MTATRREFLKVGAVTAATLGSESARVRSMSGERAMQARVRTVRTPVLEIGYEEHGPADGFPIILLHGFPYDIRSWDGVPEPLVTEGHRVLVPYLRGYGPTRFLE